MRWQWSVVRAACSDVYGRYKSGTHTNWGAHRDYIYQQYYRGAATRTSVPLHDQTFAGLVQAWNTSLADVFKRDYDPGASITIQGKSSIDGQNVWAYGSECLATMTSMDALLTDYRKPDANLSRFQILVDYRHVGLPLCKLLDAVVSDADPIDQWKVMAPELGAKGPDSAVFYLTRMLEDSAVQVMAQKVQTALQGKLDIAARCPFGLQQVLANVEGLYGIDLPPEQYQKAKLRLTPGQSVGSAGSIVAAIIDLAAYSAHHYEQKGDRQLLPQPVSDEVWVKTWLARILTTDLSWTLDG